MPPGISLNGQTGLITGTPTTTGTSTFTVTFSNGHSSGGGTLTFTSLPTVPVLSGLAAWFNAGSGVSTAGTNVTQWADQSGNGNNATQSNSQYQPQLSSDPSSGNQVLNFSSASQYSNIGNNFLNLATPQVNDVTVIAVSYNNALYVTESIIGLGSGGQGAGNVRSFGLQNGYQSMNGVNGNVFPTNTRLSISTATVATGSSAVNFYFGGEVGSSQQLTGLQPVTGSSFIGKDGSGQSDGWYGGIAEILVYNRVLSQAEREQVEAYLALKYQIPYALAAPVITPNGGSGSTVTISPIIASATLRYTLDGSAPTNSSPIYTAPLTLSQSAIVSCGYFINGNVSSPLASAQFYVGDSGNIGISDAWQIQYFGHTGINPNALSPGGSGLTNLQDYLYGYNPTLYSTNGDGLSDATNRLLGYAGNNLDIDHDGLTNSQELAIGTDPFNPDTDGDGHLDGADFYPLDPTRWQVPSDPGDTIPPTITLTAPQGATLISP